MRKIVYLLIIALGLVQVLGYMLGNKTLRGLGMATCSSPLPIVFTEVKGVETFASDFFIQFTDDSGLKQRVQITPALYSTLKGPYNRRNIYGAAIAYGPVLKKDLLESVLQYGLCKKVLLKEMELPLTGNDYNIIIQTKTTGRKDEWILKPSCSL
jgi:hypothetical protein